MSTFQVYPLHKVLLRRAGAVSLGILAFPFMLFYRDRARFWSYLYRVWTKTSDKPVWLARSENAISSTQHH